MTTEELRKYERAVAEAEQSRAAAERAEGALEELRKEAKKAVGTSDLAKLIDMEEDVKIELHEAEGHLKKAYEDYRRDYGDR